MLETHEVSMVLRSHPEATVSVQANHRIWHFTRLPSKLTYNFTWSSGSVSVFPQRPNSINNIKPRATGKLRMKFARRGDHTFSSPGPPLGEPCCIRSSLYNWYYQLTIVCSCNTCVKMAVWTNCKQNEVCSKPMKHVLNILANFQFCFPYGPWKRVKFYYIFKTLFCGCLSSSAWPLDGTVWRCSAESRISWVGDRCDCITVSSQCRGRQTHWWNAFFHCAFCRPTWRLYKRTMFLSMVQACRSHHRGKKASRKIRKQALCHLLAVYIRILCCGVANILFISKKN